ncbi:MAG: hydrogenase formation protein HypD [Desulforudis sp.]|jgi:hydrogenase expression/formation protein HypD|nr:hydrogenase formation protein HypD [Clostridia bacterium]MDQ7792013.1 hydrogenase formation protein HypD [Clostridia bacterium]RJX21935.1 MAG: hydrogenase formation protein HypD [Desulforudis sp.]
MQILDRFRDPEVGKALLGKVTEQAKQVAERLGRRAVFMEVCGTHTVAISKAGLRSLLGDYIDLRSGPGCPVCVTDYGDIDRMIALARTPGVSLGTFGDMMRVPGSYTSLEKERAVGADVQIFYSPADAVEWARKHPDRQMVFLGVGFETTAPGIALSILQAKTQGVSNYSVYTSHKLVPPAMHAIMADPELRLDGFILPGHATAIVGRNAFQFVADQYNLPAVVTGFETTDILDCLHNLVDQLLQDQVRVDNGYSRVVKDEGNVRAQALMEQFFEVADVSWRGFGVIPGSGMVIRPEFAAFDAAKRFDAVVPEPRIPKGCRCGDLLKGKINPHECRLFGTACTPINPVGPCMVSSEGACAAYYQYDRRLGK